MLNPKIIKKYNVPVPRYTSYPPANYFSDHFSEEDFIQSLIQSNHTSPENISIYIHIPFCKKICFYCGCNTSPISKTETIKKYVQALKTEINRAKEFLDTTRPVSQIHYGGGTPNAIPAEWLEEINQLLFSTFRFIEKPEIAIECNPAQLDEPYIQKLKTARFNRFSIGIQDFNPEVLKMVNRDPSKIPLQDLLFLLKKDNNEVAVNLDFIYGLPGQTIESFQQTIEKAIEIKPDRLVTFSYAHVPWFNKAQQKLEKIGLPDQMDKLKMYETAYGLLTRNGYEAIGLDHYALEKDELSIALKNKSLHRNFQGYCTRRTTGQVYAFGISAISQLSDAYAQNTKSVQEFIQQMENGNLSKIKGYVVSKEEKIIREVINELMCNKQIVWKNIADRFNMSTEQVKSTVTYNNIVLEEFASEKIIHLSDERISMTEEGILFIRNVASSFDPLINSQQNSFSKPF